MEAGTPVFLNNAQILVAIAATFDIGTVPKKAQGAEGVFGFLVQLLSSVPLGSLFNWEFGVDWGLIFEVGTSISQNCPTIVVIISLPGIGIPDSAGRFSLFILSFANISLITLLSLHPVSQ
jgi:hypothetical protein